MGNIMQDIIVFGKGRYYRSKAEAIAQKYHVIAFLDNMVKPGTVLSEEGEIPVYNPEDIEKLPKVPIMTMSARFFEMWQQLTALRVEEKRILFGVELEPYYDEVENLIHEQRGILYSEKAQLVLKCEGGEEYRFHGEEEYKEVIRRLQRKRDLHIEMIAGLPLKPVSRRCGFERGTPIDRYYIEKFISAQQGCIQGNIMEVADDQYTKKFAHNIEKTYVMHVEGWGKDVVQANLETGQGVLENTLDCFICTQTIQMIYDMKAAVHNIHRMLKPGGSALVTIAGIAGLSLYDYYRWGEYWRVTPKALEGLFGEVFGKDKTEVFSYGNVKTTIAFLYGVCVEDLDENDFSYNDEQFPLLLGCMVRK